MSRKEARRPGPEHLAPAHPSHVVETEVDREAGRLRIEQVQRGPALQEQPRAQGRMPTRPRCARLEGFSVHAGVAVRAHRRDQVERLCRDLLRPPVAQDRLTATSGGQRLSIKIACTSR
jgi:hypothetical protein